MAFGVPTLKEHSLMFGYSTLALDQTGKPPSNLHTDAMSRRIGDMTKGSERLNTIYTIGSIDYWWDGEIRYNLQEIGCYTEWEKGCPLLQSDRIQLPNEFQYGEPQWCRLEPDPLLIKGHFMNPLIYRQLKDTFTSSTTTPKISTLHIVKLWWLSLSLITRFYCHKLFVHVTTIIPTVKLCVSSVLEVA